MDVADGVRLAWRAVGDADPHEVARTLLRELLGPGTRLVSGPCPRCGGDHGPVRAPGTGHRVSIAYAGPLAVVAVRHGDAPLGLDAEPDDDAHRAAVAQALGGGAALRAWTRVEAALKADGRGLGIDPADVRVSGGPDAWTARVPGTPAPLSGRDVDGVPGTIVSVATGTPEDAAGRSTG